MTVGDRAAGVLLGQGCGDALGVPYEFASGPPDGHPEMIGGGLGPYEPGEWSDDTQMAVVIAQTAATGADLTSAEALDKIAEGFLQWRRHGASDIGNQTSRVLAAAERAAGPAGARLTAAAAEDARRSQRSAGNGALMRTSVVGLTRLHDRAATAAAAAAVAALTHADDDVADSCVLWTEAVRRAVAGGELDLTGGLDLLPAERRETWATRIADAERREPATFTANGWTVTALQAAWSSITHTRRPGPPRAGHLVEALETAVRIGHDTDTVAAITGGLIGAYLGASAIPARWRRQLHGWPGLHAHDLVALAVLTAHGGKPDRHGWPTADRMPYGAQRRLAVPHPHDDGVVLGTIADLGSVADAVVSLCRLGQDQVPARGVPAEDHVEFWLIDSDDPADNPHLDFVLTDIAHTIRRLRDEGKTVLVHCVAAEQRTPSAALAYARLLGIPQARARRDIAAALPAARGRGRLWDYAWPNTERDQTGHNPSKLNDDQKEATMSEQAHGHVFVLYGKIGEIGCDAVVVPTDAKFSIRSGWDALDGGHPWAEHKPRHWGTQSFGRSRAGAPVWFIDSVSDQATGSLLSDLLDDIVLNELPAAHGRVLPLVLVPVLGIQGGGHDAERGKIVGQLLDTARAFTACHDIDIAIVTPNTAIHAALQHRRRENVGDFFDSATTGALASPQELGQRAADGSLALFIAAGASIPAGLPSWSALIQELVGQVEGDEPGKVTTEDLDGHSTLDQAQYLATRLGPQELSRRVAEITARAKQPSLAHILLAALNCQAAVTTNYDNLYERAVESVGESLTVLPARLPEGSERWLLKMHGSADRPDSIVLTRDQFTSFDAASGPSGAVLQTLLLTKHLLIVGSSMTDDNLLRLIHETRLFRDHATTARRATSSEGGTTHTGAARKFGTVLGISDNPVSQEIYNDTFDWVTMPGDDSDESRRIALRSRSLQIYLDCVVAYATQDAPWLLDKRFGDLLPSKTGELADEYRHLAQQTRKSAGQDRGNPWRAASAALNRLGATGE